MGRPNTFSWEIVEHVAERLAEGVPLAVICREPGMTKYRTFQSWIAKYDEVSEYIARARDCGEDVIAADCLHIADTPCEGVETIEKADGTIEKRRGDMLGHRKLQVDTRLKLLAKWNPKRWAERNQVELSGPDGAPLTSVNLTTSDPTEASRLYQAMVAAK